MRQYETFEVSWQGKTLQENETLFRFPAEFSVRGKTKKVFGFYAGNGTYKVRYYPEQEGEVSWIAEGIPGVERASGQENCERAVSHGRIRAEEDHFCYEDGTVYYPFGTTVYALIHQEKERIEETLSTLSHAPFNKIRFCIFPKHYSFNKNEPERFAFERTEEGFDYSRPCYPFWDALETVLTRLDGMQIQADLILFHPYDHWGFAKMTGQQSLDYLDYLIRRLSAFPNVWWSLANEYDLMNDFEPERWPVIAEKLGSEDPWNHLLSNHNFVTYWDFGNKDTTHCCLQDSDATQIPRMQKKYGKPVILDEMGYEGNIPYNWGNLSGFEMVNRFWKAVSYGGYATHGETFMEHMDDDQVLWWSKGGTLKGQSAERIAFLRALLESLPGPLTAYHPDNPNSFETQEDLRRLIENRTPGFYDNDVMITSSKMDDDNFQKILKVLVQPVIHCGDEVFLTYLGDMCTIYTTLDLPEDGEYRIEIIDVWEMTRETIMERVCGKTEITLPGKAGMAVLATKM